MQLKNIKTNDLEDYLESDERFKEYIESSHTWDIKCDDKGCERRGCRMGCYTLNYNKCVFYVKDR